MWSIAHEQIMANFVYEKTGAMAQIEGGKCTPPQAKIAAEPAKAKSASQEIRPQFDFRRLA
jgi:hypothetical protein